MNLINSYEIKLSRYWRPIFPFASRPSVTYVNYYQRRIEMCFIKETPRRGEQQRHIVCDTSPSASP